MPSKKVTDGMNQLIKELKSRKIPTGYCKTAGAAILSSDTKVITTTGIKSITELGPGNEVVGEKGNCIVTQDIASSGLKNLNPDNSDKSKVHSEMEAIERETLNQFRKRMEGIENRQKRDAFVLDYVSKTYSECAHTDSAIDVEICIKKQVAKGVEIYNTVRKELDAI